MTAKYNGIKKAFVMGAYMYFDEVSGMKVDYMCPNCYKSYDGIHLYDKDNNFKPCKKCGCILVHPYMFEPADEEIRKEVEELNRNGGVIKDGE